MFLTPALGSALDRIAERAADVRRAYTPGAVPQHDDVANTSAGSDFTLNPLSVLAPSDDYFITTGEQGRRIYTRDGAFSIDRGRLVDATGSPILGFTGGSAVLRELEVDPVDAALGRVRSAAVQSDGTFVYTRDAIDPRNGSRQAQQVPAGRIALARFPAGTRLEGNGARGVPPAGVAVKTGMPGENEFGALTPMRRERSRIDVDESIRRLKEAYLAFDALHAAERAKARLGKTAMDLLK